MEDETNEIAALLREIGAAYSATMEAIGNMALSPAALHVQVLDGMRRIGEARETIVQLLGEEAALPLIRATVQERGGRDDQ